MTEKPIEYELNLTVNGNRISRVLIGRHYLKKHHSYMSDVLILELVASLDGHTFSVDSTTDGIEYYVADVELTEVKNRCYRIIWLFEGDQLEVLGVINAYRRTKKKG